MGEVVIDLQGVGKRYRLGEHHGGGADLRERIVGLGRRLRGQAPTPPRSLWSLRDVSFQVERGEAVGVVGSNGSGKSTLLKVVSNITPPTEGICRTRGRIGSLLEVGAGFHGELTGLENTYLNGAILGMSRREVRQRVDEIVAFAGIDGFMDTPVKRYSSGMYLRLGFAIAAHLEADVLVVDEVLAVGDVEFQRRCLGKMSDIERSGRTVLFVSHDMEAMARLCTRTVWLDHGRVMADGPTTEVIDAYVRSTGSGGATATFATVDAGRAQATQVGIVDEDGRELASFSSWTSAWIAIDLVVREPGAGLDVGATVCTVRGVRLFGETLVESTGGPIVSAGRHRLLLAIPKILMPGTYTVDLWLGTAYETLAWHERVVTFSIATTDHAISNDRLLGLDMEWSVQRETDA